MKKAIKLYLVLALLTTSNIQSQELNLSNSCSNTNEYSVMALSVSAKNNNYNFTTYKPRKVTPRLRNTGIIFTVMGVGFIAGGISMVKSADGVTYYSSNTYNGQTTTEGNATGAFGALGIVGGSIAVLGGVTMWYFGSKNLKKRGGHRASLNVSPGSVYLTYNF